MIYKLICDLPRIEEWDFDELIDDILSGDNDDELHTVRYAIDKIQRLYECVDDVKEALQERYRAIRLEKEAEGA